jgi:hypothetical protein
MSNGAGRLGGCRKGGRVHASGRILPDPARDQHWGRQRIARTCARTGVRNVRRRVKRLNLKDISSRVNTFRKLC